MLVAGLVSALGRRRLALVVARRRSNVHRILMRRRGGVMQVLLDARVLVQAWASEPSVARRIDAQQKKL